MTANYQARTFEGRPCDKGHPLSTVRYTCNGHCVQCARIGKERRKAANPTQVRVNRLHARAKPASKALILLRSMKHRAKTKGLEFTLSLKWIQQRLDVGVCELSGLPFTFPIGQGRQMRSPHIPSIDRIDASQGYTEDNCRMILWGLNAAFAAWGAETFAPIAQAWLNKRN